MPDGNFQCCTRKDIEQLIIENQTILKFSLLHVNCKCLFNKIRFKINFKPIQLQEGEIREEKKI